MKWLMHALMLVRDEATMTAAAEAVAAIAADSQTSQARSPIQTANELREKLLREKVMASRKASANAKGNSVDHSN
ncbi:MAG: hypothetical protein Q9201_000233 [Fulgogasparrea decipioides]